MWRRGSWDWDWDLGVNGVCNGGCQYGGEGGGVDGFEVPECYCAFLFVGGSWDVDVNGDGQVVGNGEVSVGYVVDGGTRGTNQV